VPLVELDLVTVRLDFGGPRAKVDFFTPGLVEDNTYFPPQAFSMYLSDDERRTLAAAILHRLAPNGGAQ